jgi:hypothetical protein
VNSKILNRKTASNLLLVTASLAAVYVGASPASAFTVGSLNPTSLPGSQANKAPYTVEITTADIGKTFKTYWILDDGTSQQLNAKAYFTVTDLTSSVLSLEATFTNQTDASFQAAITSIGLGVSPNATKVSFDEKGDVFKHAYVETGKQSFPGGYKNIDICVSSFSSQPSGNCPGGSINKGLQSGGSEDTFGISITGNYGTTPVVTLQTLPVKFQTSEGSFELLATKPHTVPTPPATLGLVAFGALGMLSTLKRNLKHKQKSNQPIVY